MKKILLVRYQPDSTWVNGWWKNEPSKNFSENWSKSLFGIGPYSAAQCMKSWISLDSTHSRPELAYWDFAQHKSLQQFLRQHNSLDLKQQAVLLALRGCTGARALSQFLESL